jgi:hypothetical protein
MKKLYFIIFIITGFFNYEHLHAQSKTAISSQVYPQVKGYLSFIIPMLTINKNETTTEFEKATTIGFPVGINVYYSDKFAFSLEITPSVQWTHPSNGPATSKTNNLLFDPGPMFRFKHGFNIITRLAFETQGRYGFTPVFNKVYLQTKAVNYFAALSVPARFGNSQPASVGLNLQIGFTFN